MLIIGNLLFQFSHVTIKIPLKKIIELEHYISKLYCLDLDILSEILKPYYSDIGRPATFQPKEFRSFSLIFFQKKTSVTNWVKKLHASKLFATCISCTENYVPSLGAHYDFISRLCLSDLSNDRIKLKKHIRTRRNPPKLKYPVKTKSFLIKK